MDGLAAASGCMARQGCARRQGLCAGEAAATQVLSCYAPPFRYCSALQTMSCHMPGVQVAEAVSKFEAVMVGANEEQVRLHGTYSALQA